MMPPKEGAYPAKRQNLSAKYGIFSLNTGYCPSQSHPVSIYATVVCIFTGFPRRRHGQYRPIRYWFVDMACARTFPLGYFCGQWPGLSFARILDGAPCRRYAPGTASLAAHHWFLWRFQHFFHVYSREFQDVAGRPPTGVICLRGRQFGSVSGLPIFGP